VFAVFYTTAKGCLESKPLNALVSNVKKKCAFVMHELPTSADAVAATTVGFTREQFQSPATLCETLRCYVQHQATLAADGFLPADKVQFVGDTKMFYKSVFAYKNPKENEMLSCLNALGNELGLKFRVKFVKGGTRERCPFFTVDTISWIRSA
jgi:hypothetical protein